MFKFLRNPFGDAIGQLTQVFNKIQDEALNPLNMILQQVIGGIWKGDGATAFADEITNLVSPGMGGMLNIVKVGDTVDLLSKNLKRAEQIMDQADEAVERLVKSGLDDVFKFF